MPGFKQANAINFFSSIKDIQIRRHIQTDAHAVFHKLNATQQKKILTQETS